VFRLTIHQTGAEELRTMLGGLAVAVDDISPTFPEMERAFRSIEISQFQSEGASGQEGAWPALSEVYAAWKARHFPGKPILQRTGALMRSLVGRGPGSYVSTSPHSLTIGTSIPYAAFHQIEGLGRRFRPMISLTDQQAAMFQAILQRYFLATIRRGLGGRRVSVQRALVGA